MGSSLRVGMPCLETKDKPPCWILEENHQEPSFPATSAQPKTCKESLVHRVYPVCRDADPPWLILMSTHLARGGEGKAVRIQDMDRTMDDG
jgi:hypothetical protein